MAYVLRVLAVLAIVLAGTLASLRPAFAETLTFQMSSDHEDVVQIVFFSQLRKAVWPGGGKVYQLEDYDVHNFKLNCRYGERICYGAYVSTSDTYWGVGYQRKKGCTSCCYTCNGGTTKLIHLSAE